MRLMQSIVFAIVALVSLCVPALPAQTYATHAVAPYVVGTDASVGELAALLLDARTPGRVKDAAFIGDSRVTANAIRGVGMIASLNQSVAAMYGDMGATPWATAYDAGAGSPPAPYNFRISRNGTGTLTFHSTANGSSVLGNCVQYMPDANTNGGFMALVMPDYALGPKQLGTNVGGRSFDKNRPLVADVLVSNRRGPTTNSLRVQLLSEPTTTANWGTTVLGQTVDSSLGLSGTTLYTGVAAAITAAAADNSINDANSGMPVFTPGVYVRVAGFATNPATMVAKVVSSTPAKLILATANHTLVNESPAGAVTVNDFTVVRKTYGPFANDSQPYVALNTRNGAAPSGNNFEIINQRLRSETGRGLVFTGYGIGGSKVADLLNDVANGGAAGDVAGVGSMKNAEMHLRAMNPDVIFQILGQNDTGSSITKAQLKAAELNLIRTFRGWLGRPVLWVIVNNPHNGGLSSVNQALTSSYMEPLSEIAATEPSVVVLNLQRALEDLYGWNVTSGPTLVSSSPNWSPSGWTYRNAWREGINYVVGDWVNLNGIDGWAMTATGGSGSFTIGETVTQGSATGTLIQVAGNVHYVAQHQTSSADFSTTGTLTGGASGATRTTVSACVPDGLFARGGAGQCLDYQPRDYWYCIADHTSGWNRKPGSMDQSTNGFAQWIKVFPYYDVLDSAHWHGVGQIAVGRCIADLLFNVENDAAASRSIPGFSGSPRGRVSRRHKPERTRRVPSRVRRKKERVLS